MHRAPDTTIRPLQGDEWQLLKHLRLAALADSPDAFGPDHASVAAESEAYWQRGAETFSDDGHRLFIADCRGEAHGLISAVKDQHNRGHLGALWVAPELRGTRIGALLFDRAVDWLVEVGCQQLLLHVTDTNTQARAWYARRGFRETGVTEPLRAGSSLLNVEMSRGGAPGTADD